MSKKKKQTAAPENTAPETETKAETTETEQEQEQKFEKDIKVLWIYTTLFCLFALVLIIASSLIQGKINSTAEYYQGLYEGEKTSSQSTIKNVKTENTSLKNANEKLRAENERLQKDLETSTETINTAAELAESYEYLILAQKESNSGSRAKAKELYAKIDGSILQGDTLEIYQKLGKTLGV